MDSQQSTELTIEMDFLHCPFNWTEFNTKSLDGGRKEVSWLRKKFEETGDWDSSIWYKFILCIILCYEYSCKQDSAHASESLRECEELFEAAGKDETSIELFEQTKIACRHVVQACRAFLNHLADEFEEARRCLKDLVHFNYMDNANKAALYGIRAAVLAEYGRNGWACAVVYARIAMSLYPSQAEWHFMYGHFLQRVRQHKPPVVKPDRMEIEALETAVRLRNSVTYKSILAFSYLDEGSQMFHSEDKDMAFVFYEKVSQLLHSSLKQQDSIFVNILCARGFVLLPHGYKDLDLAIKCCRKVLSLRPDHGEAHFQLGIIYGDRKCNYREAEKHFHLALKAKYLGAAKRLFYMRYWLNEEYDPLIDEEMNYLKTCGVLHSEAEAVCQIGSFFLFVRNDIQESFKQFSTLLIGEEELLCHFKDHVCTFLRTTWRMNILHVLCDESRLALRDCWDEGTKKFYNKVIDTCKRIDPEAGKEPPISYRKKVWQETVARKQVYQEWHKRYTCQKFIE